MQKVHCHVIAKEERLKQSPVFMDFERKIASLSLAMTVRIRLIAQTRKGAGMQRGKKN